MIRGRFRSVHCHGFFFGRLATAFLTDLTVAALTGADGVVSAGSTGASLTGTTVVAGSMKGVSNTFDKYASIFDVPPSYLAANSSFKTLLMESL